MLDIIEQWALSGSLVPMRIKVGIHNGLCSPAQLDPGEWISPGFKSIYIYR